MNAVDDIKERLNVEDVVAEYVELRKAGKNFKGLSPFTQEKTPSFVVSPDKQIWHCFSSNKGGDMFTFIEEVEGVEFREALEILARKANINLEDYRTTNTGPRVDKKTLEQTLKAAARFYQQTLVSNEFARNYAVTDRGLNRQMIQVFSIGYAPQDGQALRNHLQGSGYSDKDMALSGLVVERSGRHVDMFRGRLLVALCDRSGNPIGFTGRILISNENAPKYINTAQTPLYDKSRHVFGLHLAKDAIREQDLCVLVEGNMDVVATHQFGYRNTVATAGTALTSYQLKQIKRLSENVALAFDNDKAGLAATLRAIPIAQSVGIQLFIVEMPGGKDPDDVVRSDQQAWEHAVDTRQYVFDWLIKHYSEQFDVTSARGKAEMSNRVIDALKLVRDPVEQEHYVQVLATKIGASANAVMRKLQAGIKDVSQPRMKSVKAEPQSQSPRRAHILANNLLALTLAHPESRMMLSEIDETSKLSDEQQAVVHVLVNSAASGDTLAAGNLKKYENFVRVLQLIAEENYNSWSPSDATVEADRLTLSLIELLKEQNQTKLSQAIRDAELAGDHTKAAKLLEDWHNAVKEH